MLISGQSQLSTSQTSSPLHRRSRGTIEAPDNDGGFDMFGLGIQASSSPASLRSKKGTKRRGAGVAGKHDTARVSASDKPQAMRSKSVPKRNVRRAKQHVSHSPKVTSSSENENEENEDNVNVRKRASSFSKSTNKHQRLGRSRGRGSKTNVRSEDEESASESDEASSEKPVITKTRRARRQSFEAPSGMNDALDDKGSTSSVAAKDGVKMRGRKRNRILQEPGKYH